MSRLRQELFCTPSPMVFFFEPIMLASKQWMISLRIIKVHKPEPKAITEAEMIVAGWDATSGPGGACPWRFFSRSSTYLIKGGKCVAHLQLRYYIWAIRLPFKTLKWSCVTNSNNPTLCRKIFPDYYESRSHFSGRGKNIGTPSRFFFSSGSTKCFFFVVVSFIARLQPKTISPFGNISTIPFCPVIEFILLPAGYGYDGVRFGPSPLLSDSMLLLYLCLSF